MPDKARLDPRWWNKNRPACLGKSAVDKPLGEFVRISEGLEKSGQVNEFFKAVSSLKSAIAKDQQTAKKAKDKDAVRLLSELENLAHEFSHEREVHLTLKSDLSWSGLSNVPGISIPPRTGQGAVEFVNRGDTDWVVVKNSRAIASARANACQALPKNVRPADLTEWKTERADWTCSLTNERNEEAVKIDFHLRYQWNGQSATIGGLFLNDFGVWADVKVLWGYSVDARAAVACSPYNAGSSDAVDAAIGLAVSVRVATPLESSTKRWTIVCHGNRARELR